MAIPGYEVIKPGEPGAGQFYSSYCERWMTWLVSNNPESNNYGPVYFLHCTSCMRNDEDSGYRIQPVVRIGGQAITINAGEFIFVPVITSAAETIDSGVPDNPSALLNYVRTDLEAGDNPPHREQATIGIDPDPSKPAVTRLKEAITKDIDKHFLISNVFSLYVPPAQPGTSLLRNCFDVPISTEGSRNCVVGGWWILIRFTQPGKTYYIHTYAKGRGQYQASMFYQIDVSPTSMLPKAPSTPPQDWSKHLIENLARKKQADGEIDNTLFGSITKVLS